jgi:hypothetical protein
MTDSRDTSGFAVALAVLLSMNIAEAKTPSEDTETAAAPAASTAEADAGRAALSDKFWSARADHYSVQWGGVSLGDGVITLKPVGGDCFEYKSETDPIAIVRWTYGSPSEFSRFCVRDGEVYPSHFEYRNGKSDDNFTLDFDAARQRAKTMKGGEIHEINVPEPVYDRFSLQEAVRLWVARNAGRLGSERDFTFLEDKNTLKTYRFRIQRTEKVKTPAGTFDTLLVERIDNPKKSYRYWLAPAREYAPVKIEHIHKGKTELQMALER